MDRARQETTQDRGVTAEGLGSVIGAVVGMMTAMRSLRRERDRLMARHAAGLAGPDDLHRYQMTRLRMLMMASASRGVRNPRGVAEVLAHRDLLALVNRSDQFPEPQPS